MGWFYLGKLPSVLPKRQRCPADNQGRLVDLDVTVLFIISDSSAYAPNPCVRSHFVVNWPRYDISKT